jgi:hypothetical protein
VEAPEPTPPSPGALESFLRAGLARLGLEASADEMAVMGAVDSIYWPHIEALMEADLENVEAEPGFHPSRAP